MSAARPIVSTGIPPSVLRSMTMAQACLRKSAAVSSNPSLPRARKERGSEWPSCTGSFQRMAERSPPEQEPSEALKSASHCRFRLFTNTESIGVRCVPDMCLPASRVLRLTSFACRQASAGIHQRPSDLASHGFCRRRYAFRRWWEPLYFIPSVDHSNRLCFTFAHVCANVHTSGVSNMVVPGWNRCPARPDVPPWNSFRGLTAPQKDITA